MVVEQRPDLRDPNEAVGTRVDYRDIDGAPTNQELELLPPFHRVHRVLLTEHDPKMGQQEGRKEGSNVQRRSGRVAQKCMLLAQNARLRNGTRPYLRSEATPITTLREVFLMRRK